MSTTTAKVHLDPEKRHDFVLLFDVSNGNPNGDPDAGNSPRVDPETMHGLVTDVAIKRKIRDYVALVLEQPIFIQSRDSLNSLIVKAFQEVGVEPVRIQLQDEDLIDWFVDNAPEGFTPEDDSLIYGGDSPRETDIRKLLHEAAGDAPDVKPLRDKLAQVAKAVAVASKGRRIPAKKRVEARQHLCKTYFDIRMFGAVLSTGLNAGQVRGPVQLTFARSLHPIFPLDLSITRQARTTTVRMQTGTTEMGRKPIVPYGLYRAHGFYSPALAKQTGVTESDLAALWEALQRMFEFDRSAARGEMVTRGLYVFTHDHPRGNLPAHQVLARVQADLHAGIGEPRRFDDYAITTTTDDLAAKGVTFADLTDWVADVSAGQPAA